jgi:hypothetical protein
MALHIELSGDMTATELAAVSALIDVLRGEKPRTVAEPVKVPEAKPVEPVKAIIPPPPVEAPPLVDTTEEFVRPDGPEPVGDVDATGLPWDGRIHASTKTQKADKTWTQKRGVAADLVTSVTAELRANLAADGSPGPVDDAPVFTDPAQAFGVPVPPPPPVEVAAVIPPPPPAEADGGMADFARIMRIVVEKQKAGALSTEMASGIARQLGLTDMRGLATRLDLIPAFEALLP